MLKNILNKSPYLKQLPLCLAIKYIILNRLKSIFNIRGQYSYSLFGEDNIIKIYIKQLLNKTTPGFYLDIGCNDPIIMSNTFGLYCDGWRGVAIDANIELIKKFKKTRPNDIVICAAISDESKELTFYEFENHLVSTMDKELYERWIKDSIWKFHSERKVQTQTLNSIIEQYNLKDQEIDLLCVDVEGHDINVLKSVDLNKYRPKLIIVEALDFDIYNFSKNEVCNYLEQKNYTFLGYISETCYFADKGI